MAKDFAVNVKGLAEFRRNVRRVDAEANREIGVALSHGAEIAADAARLLAPRRTGALAASYRAYRRGNHAGVRSNLPYAPVIEFGGTIRPRGVPIMFKRQAPVTRAVERNETAIVREVEQGIVRAAQRTGW